MHYYNEIYFLLFGFMFVMLAVSTAPFYRKDAIEKPSVLLAGIPLAAAASYFLFLLVPLVPMSRQPGQFAVHCLDGGHRACCCGIGEKQTPAN